MIIQFKDINKQSKEDKFMETLTEEQTEMFYEIIQEIAKEYDELNNKYLEKVAELEVAKIKSKLFDNKE